MSEAPGGSVLAWGDLRVGDTFVMPPSEGWGYDRAMYTVIKVDGSGRDVVILVLISSKGITEEWSGHHDEPYFTDELLCRGRAP